MKNTGNESNSQIRELEVWADSFKEGEFILSQINQAFSGNGIKYEYGFVPVLTIDVNSTKIKFVVYGYYTSWKNIPEKISELLLFGKSDAIIYDPKDDKIIFVYEETAATPTGNQALQRLERTWYSAYQRVPFVYLVGKHGLHKDGGIRTNSIWPSYLCLKLSTQYKIPSLALLYGSKTEPENYDIGNSIEYLRSIIEWYIREHLELKPKQETLQKLLESIYKEMCIFIKQQHKEISEDLAGKTLLEDNRLSKYIVNRALQTDNDEQFSNEFKWHLTSKQQSTNKQSFDKFIKEIDKLIENRKAWWPMKGTTNRTEPYKKIKLWIDEQTSHKNKTELKTKTKKSTSIKLDQFPDQNGKKLITTTTSILTLIDSTCDFLDCIEKSFGVDSRKAVDTIIDTKIPTALYVTSSIISSGRAFKGDPFTGQSTAYSRIFSIGLNNEKERNMVAYYPNQLYSQFFSKKLEKLENKGTRCMQANFHVIIARDGIIIDPKNWSLV